MNTFFAKELGRELMDTPFRSAAWPGLMARLERLPTKDKEAVITAAENLIFEQGGRRVSMALGHIAERAQVQFAG